ncbi:SR-related and CTD-associated factor 4-like isoform X2 [Stegodyphus dumicola]|uniref:SR-related and CTD-associated factor 4-like isoform X2 n=1 Tax=Stegodyphus dumicola TaxID=202533 RepID=UPI0015AECE8C|nr:SR-related and CTD-associated factor 4-like isoform X2 [Stegodyphus dumicola]
MEVVRIFNNELSSLYEVKPPISKAKMTQITKSAIKGIKFYKHIVQSVEKFIQKCRPEYKVPGLYVVDSIVRQSRHQFGADKDVFGPRFVKNITTTFQHLFKCAEDDRPKIIRVLNLWQKNNVFPIDVIQPLLDMGHPNTSTEWSVDTPADTAKESTVNKSYPVNEDSQISRHKGLDQSSWKGWPQNNEESVPENRTYAEMSTKNLEKFTKAEMSNSADDDVSRSSLFKTQMKVEKPPEENTVKFNKKLLDFDYGDEEDEEETKNEDSHLSNQPNALALSMAQNLLSNPELLRQLQQMQQTIQQNEALSSELDTQAQAPVVKSEDNEVNYSSEVHSKSSPQAVVLPPLPFTDASNMMQYQYDKTSMPFQAQQPPLPLMETMPVDGAYSQIIPPDQHLLQSSQIDEDERVMYSMPGEPPLPPQDFDERNVMLPVEERRKERSRSRSGSRTRGRSGRHRSRSRSPRRKRSRSRSHSRKNRSRSRERERIREKERERERERERRRKGIPPIKKGCVSVCSTTLWLGHVPKSCSEVDISDTFGPYGTILSIDMIPPRGCAYVVMDRRQDGYRALQKLKNLKLHGSSIKIAWAPGKGVKGKEYKDFWEVDLGVSYVPYEKIPEDAEALDLLEEGGFIDEDSLPEHLRALRKQPEEEKQSYGSASKTGPEAPVPSYNDIQMPPNMVPPPIMPPTSVSLPMVLPHLMQPQFGLHLPGLLPPQAMVMQMPMGIPPPNPMLMVQQQSQNILSSQPLPIVGGVPQMVPRTVPPVANALQNLKSTPHTEPAIGSPMVPVTSATVPVTSAAGDATPTEEDGTSVSSPNTIHMSVPGPVSSASVPMVSTQPGHFNPILGLHNASRPMLSVPPPVSTAVTPIPYPPPNVGFNFPPPGIRPPAPGHNAAPNTQFQWMQKPCGSPYTDADSSHSANSAAARPVPPPQPGMGLHMFGNRPPFHEAPSTVSASNPPPMKDMHNIKNRDPGILERKAGEMDILGNRNASPGHHDKMMQDMVMSIDDESSMDQDFPRSDMSMGPRFQSPVEFPRMPMNMHRMRGPPGPMQGPRFPRGMHMGAPFPMRMGGPRGLGPNMHPRMEMEFQMHHGPRGPRIPGGPHRGDNMHPSHDGRDWYPRDFDGPPFERDRERRYHDDWKRESWITSDDLESDGRRMTRERDEGRREDRDRWNRDQRGHSDRSFKDESRDMPLQPGFDKNDYSEKPKPKPRNNNKNLMDDMQKLKCYQRDKKIDIPQYSRKQGKGENVDEKQTQKSDFENKESEKPKPENQVDSSGEKSCDNINESVNDVYQEHNSSVSKKERDRESRKRSRWGRTLSEEREFQQQKRNEIEMKFQSYEQSHAAQQPISNVQENQENTQTNILDNVPIEANTSIEMETSETKPGESIPETECDIQKSTPSVLDNLNENSVSANPVVTENLVTENHTEDCASVCEENLNSVQNFTSTGSEIVSDVNDSAPVYSESSQNVKDSTPVCSENLNDLSDDSGALCNNACETNETADITSDSTALTSAES